MSDDVHVENLPLAIARLALAPGDVLVMRLGIEPTAAIWERVRASLAECLPGQTLLLLGPDVELSVLRRDALDALLQAAPRTAPARIIPADLP
jgi:hypothetical protein